MVGRPRTPWWGGHARRGGAAPPPVRGAGAGVGRRHSGGASAEVTPAGDLSSLNVKTKKTWPTGARSPGAWLKPWPVRPAHDDLGVLCGHRASRGGLLAASAAARFI